MFWILPRELYALYGRRSKRIKKKDGHCHYYISSGVYRILHERMKRKEACLPNFNIKHPPPPNSANF